MQFGKKKLRGGLILALTMGLTSLMLFTPLFTTGVMGADYEVIGGAGGKGADGNGSALGGSDGTFGGSTDLGRGGKGGDGQPAGNPTTAGTATSGSVDLNDMNGAGADISANDNLTIKGGAGGVGGLGNSTAAGGGGGNGATVITSATGPVFVNNLALTGANGSAGGAGDGASNSGGVGGAGGGVTLNLSDSDVTVGGSAIFTSGDGEVKGAAANGGAGGAGGSIIFNAKKLAISGNFTLNSGLKPAIGGNAGTVRVEIQGDHSASASLSVGNNVNSFLAINAKDGDVTTTVTGGNNSSAGNGGSANIALSNLLIAKTGAGVVTLKANGGNSTGTGDSGGATFRVASLAEINNAGTNNVAVEAKSGAAATGNSASSLFSAGSLTIDNSGTGLASLTSESGTATAGNTGEAKIAVGGTAQISNAAAGDITVEAKSGVAATGNSGSGIFESQALSITKDGAGNIKVSALAATPTSGAGGLGKLTTAAVTITNNHASGNVTVSATGGSSTGTSLGGKAELDTNAITIRNTNGGAVLFTAQGGASASGNAGASTFNAKGIDITNSAGGTVEVTSAGGSASTLGAGGAAVLKSTGAISLADAGTAASASFKVAAQGGAGAGTDKNGGDARIEAASITLTSTNAAGGSALTLSSIGGAAANGLGGKGEIIVSGDVKVLANGAGSAGVTVQSQASTGANRDGVEGKLKAKSLTIQATSAGNATVTVTGGNGTGSGVGGTANVEVDGNLVIQGSESGAGAAALNLTAGTGGTPGDRTVTVGDTLEVASGQGAAYFEAGTLKAKNIKLKEGSGLLTFTAANLDVTTNDTAITLDGTGAAAATTAIAAATLAGDHTLSIGGAAATDTISLGTLNVKQSDYGRLALANSGNLSLTSLNVQNASLTFVLPEDIANNATYLTTTNAFLTGSNLYLAGPGLENLKPGDAITLIDATTTTGTPTGSGEAPLGVTRLIDYSIVVDNHDVKSVFGARKANPRAKALSEAHLSGSAFVNQAGDLIADAGVTNARLAATSNQGGAMFSAVSYSDLRYETGSHVDVRGLSLLIGAAYGLDVNPGKLTFGAFFEYGTGSYDTFNEFANYASVNGEGDTDYVGGGLFGRLDILNDSGSTYIELSARAGRVSSDFVTGDFRPSIVAYDGSSAYYGLHAGLGRIFNLSETTSLDLYAKYFWTHQKGQSVSVPDPVTFGDINSHRVKAGARISHELTDTVGMYFGAAYEREFAGKAEATSQGFALDVPKLRGNSGMGELGLTVNASQNVDLDFGLQGHAGDRKGVSGDVRLNVRF